MIHLLFTVTRQPLFSEMVIIILVAMGFLQQIVPTRGATTTTTTTTADFVIVGGGTAGCVLATRLCQRLKGARIVVLEQGEERSPDDDLVTEAMGLTTNMYDFYEPLMVRHLTEPNPSLFDPAAGDFGRIIDLYEMEVDGRIQ